MIREASLADCQAIARLNEELGYSGETGEIRRRLEPLLGQPAHAVLLDDTAEGEVTGWIHCSIVSTLETETFAEIRGLVVGGPFRSRGIGAELVRAAEAWAARSGVTRMRVRSNVTRERARLFYERLGYRVTKTQNVFDRPLA